MSKAYTVWRGKFICQICKQEVHSMRSWYETGEATWMCKDKHLSTVQLYAKKKSKKDYDREE